MVLGIDIGGTAVKLGIVDENATLIEFQEIPTLAQRGTEAVVAAILEAAKPLCDGYHPVAVGIGCAGRIHPPSGTVLRAGHLPFKNTPLATMLSEALSLPAVIENDANCAMLAEAKAGACTDCRDALMITIGTGIGGAVWLDGKLYSGHNFRAGEFGHFIFDRHGEPCPCGLHGCFEQYGSATALMKLATTAIAAHPDSLLAKKANGAPNGKVLFAAAKDGCPVASDVLAAYGETLAAGLNSLVKMLMPQCIVLAGGITGAGQALLDVITPHLLPEADIRITALGGHAGLLGAALLCKE